SMSYLTGDATWFDSARSRALELADRMPEGVAAAVLTTSRPSGKLVRKLDSVRGRIAGSKPTTRSSSCWRALDRAGEMLRQTGAARRDVFLFTDMTRSAWAGHEHRVLELGPDINVFVVDCAPEGGVNGAVYELRREGEPAIVGAALSLKARIVASGGPLVRTVQFEFDGQGVERHDVHLEPGQETTLHFSVLLSESGHHWGRVTFLNPDALPHDDARTFTVDVAPEVPVLCVEDFPEQTLRSASYFFRLALNPWGQGSRGIFRIDRASPRQLAELSLAPFDAVVLVGAGDMTETAWRRVGAYVSGGGALLTFLGPETDDLYRTAAARAVLPARVGPVMAAPPESPFVLRVVKAAHPFVAALNESGATLAQVRYRQCRQLGLGADAAELLSFGPGLPALVLSGAAGKVAVFAGTADERWGEFAKTEPFTPFCHELLLHLTGRSAGGVASVPVGTQLPIKFEVSRWPTLVRVTPPGARQAERLLPGTTPGQHTYWKTDAPGYYRVEFERKDKRWHGGFAVNTVPIESRLEKVPFETVRESIRAGTVELVAAASLGEAPTATAGAVKELAPFLACLALVLMVAECFLANRFYGGEKESPSAAP
ncbi:MAG: hypothetical protein ACYTFZ_11145, partial [Planctomycetota bacterium]